VTTAVLIFPLIPKALAIPSPQELQLANADLAKEVAAHKLTLAKLEQARERLEQRVDARTKDLSEATERFRSLFEHAPVAMLMADKAGALRQANSAAERLFDYSKDELLERSVDMLLPEANREAHGRLRAEFHADSAARSMGVGRELHARRKGGQQIPVEIGLNPLKAGGETFVVASILDISMRRQAEQRMQFVMRELTHRSKNLLAVIQAIARQAAASTPNIDAFHREFGERLRGLARSHDLLVASDWQGASIGELVHSQLAFLGRTDQARVKVEGHSMTLTPEAAQNLGLALHELVTNAVKYGALSTPVGAVAVGWTVQNGPAADERLLFTWRETGGPAAKTPSRRGFGHAVLEEIVPGMFGGSATLAFAPEGVTWTLDVPFARVSNSARNIAECSLFPAA
jgi:PAS domain S-box-containing protein